MAEEKDGLDLLIEDHRAVDEMFTMIEQAMGEDAGRVQELTRDVIGSLTLHSQIEEDLVYPLARETLGEEQVDEAIGEHQEVDDLMTTLEGLAPEDDNFKITFDELVANVKHHVEEEETEMFPQLREKAAAERLRTLGTEIAKMKQGSGQRTS